MGRRGKRAGDGVENDLSWCRPQSGTIAARSDWPANEGLSWEAIVRRRTGERGYFDLRALRALTYEECVAMVADAESRKPKRQATSVMPPPDQTHASLVQALSDTVQLLQKLAEEIARREDRKEAA